MASPRSSLSRVEEEEDFGNANENGLGVVERRMLEKGKREHRETTQSTERVLKVAEQTTEIATATLVEVQRQGLVLDRTENNIATVEMDVQEASRLMKFMRRWCCFQVLCCCDCFDPDVAMDNTRQRRLRERQQQDIALREEHAIIHEAQHDAVQRLTLKHDPAYNGDDIEARSELFAATIRRKTTSYEEVPGLGYGLPHADRIEIQEETRIQDRNLDRIGTAVTTLRVMSLELQGELSAQAPQLDTLGDRVHTAHDNLGNLARSARRV